MIEETRLATWNVLIEEFYYEMILLWSGFLWRFWS